MPAAVLLAVGVHDLWYALPLVLVVSLVYGASRHEHMTDILESAGRNAIWIGCFMLIILGLLYAASSWL